MYAVLYNNAKIIVPSVACCVGTVFCLVGRVHYSPLKGMLYEDSLPCMFELSTLILNYVSELCIIQYKVTFC